MLRINNIIAIYNKAKTWTRVFYLKGELNNYSNMCEGKVQSIWVSGLEVHNSIATSFHIKEYTTTLDVTPGPDIINKST